MRRRRRSMVTYRTYRRTTSFSIRHIVFTNSTTVFKVIALLLLYYRHNYSCSTAKVSLSILQMTNSSMDTSTINNLLTTATTTSLSFLASHSLTSNVYNLGHAAGQSIRQLQLTINNVNGMVTISEKFPK